MAAFVGTALLSGAFAGSSLAAGAAGIGFSWAAFAGSLVLGGLARALAKPPANPASSLDVGSVYAAQGRNISVRQPISPWQGIVGEARAGGNVTFAEITDDKRYLNVVVTAAYHECAAIEEILVGDEVINPDMINADGDVISGRYGSYQQVARVHSATIPGSPYQVTVSYDVSTVQSVTIADIYGDVESGQYTTQTPITDVSPSSPTAANQYSRSGNVFTFYSGRAAAAVTINYTESELHSGLRITSSLGNETGQPFPALVALSGGSWSNEHLQSGHTKIWLRFLAEGLLSGLPTISPVVRGMKLYDPRTGLTVYRPSPALALASYLCDDEVGTGAVYADEIEDTTLQAAATLCEERVLIDGAGVTFTATASTDRLSLTAATDGTPARTPRTGDGVRLTTTGTLPAGLSAATTYYVVRNGAGLVQLATSFANACAGTVIDVTDAGSGTHTITPYDQPRYTANGTFLTSERQGEIIERLLGAMAGRATHVSDRWWIFAGGYEAPTVTLDESELAGPIHIDPIPSPEDSANGVKGVYVDTANNWQPTDFPALQSATYLVLDGGEERWADLDLTGMINDSATAQRNAKIELRRRRYALSWTATFQLSAWRAMTAATVAFDFARYGWTGGAQEFEITNSRFVVIGGEGGDGAPALGVELTGRQSDSAIWDWSLSDQQLQAAVKNSNLPDPFTIAAPGAPSVTEEIYETTGSAGVRVRTTVTFEAAVGPFVQSAYVEYKAVGDAAYRRAKAFSDNSVVLDDLAPGYWLFRTQAESSSGILSDYSGTSLVLLRGLTDPPADVSGLNITPTGDGKGTLSWQRHPDLDVRIGGRILIRYSPSVSGPTWNDCAPLNPPGDVPGSATSVEVPLRTGTYHVKAEDSGLRTSVNSVFVVTTEPDLQGYNAVQTFTAQPDWTGTKSHVHVASGKLRLSGASLISEMTTPLSEWGVLSTLGGVSATGSVEFAELIDLGDVYTSRLTLALETLSFRTGDKISQWLQPMSTWGNLSGPEVADTRCKIYVATTNDDPNGTPTWSDWSLFVIGLYTARGYKFKAVLSSGNTEHNIEASVLSVSIDMPDREELQTDVASGTGTKTVTWTLTPGFKVTPHLGITAKNMATGDYYVITNEQAASFDIAFKNAAGAGVDRTFNARGKAY